jgi:integrase
MALFTLLKISRTRYMVGKKHVKPGTPGAVKVSVESPQWYAYRRDGKNQIKVRLFTDKAASMTELARLNTALERGEAGMIDPRKAHLERGASEHLEEFLPVMRAKGKSEKDKDRKETILRAFIAKLKSLSDLTTKSVDAYLSGVPGSSGNRKKHLSAISVWVEWLLRKDRISVNPLDRIDLPTGGKKTKARRALAVPLIQKLLDATRARPLAAFHERYGTEVGPGVRQRERAQKKRDAATATLNAVGRERALVYKTAVFTGLRLGEIAALRPCHLELDRRPFPRLEIPGKETKNGQQARLLLVPAFAEELAAWIKDTGKKSDDPLFHVPEGSVKIMQKDLEFAGIPYRTSQGDADFHSLRMTSNVMLGQAGIPARIRQLFMRHSDIRLTMATYDDESFLDLEAAVKAMEGLGLK